MSDYLVIELATLWMRALAAFSPGTDCWQAHSPSAAAMNRTLAKFTGFMETYSTSRRVIPYPGKMVRTAQ
jgi:hypothetical protein